jgi:hypothetical protein
MLAAGLLTLASLAAPAAAEPNAVQVLFESRHLDQVGKGSEVTYKFERKVSDPKVLGAEMTDNIRIAVNKVNDKGERDVVFKVFSGDFARDPTDLPELTVNPLFHWYLDRAVQNFRSLGGGDAQYLKYRFKEALRDKAEIEAIKFNYNGADVDAYRVSVRPYRDDPSSVKMEGFETSKFVMVVSEKVPGYFLDLVSDFESKKAGAPRLEEHISLVGMGEAK